MASRKTAQCLRQQQETSPTSANESDTNSANMDELSLALLRCQQCSVSQLQCNNTWQQTVATYPISQLPQIQMNTNGVQSSEKQRVLRMIFPLRLHGKQQTISGASLVRASGQEVIQSADDKLH